MSVTISAWYGDQCLASKTYETHFWEIGEMSVDIPFDKLPEKVFWPDIVLQVAPVFPNVQFTPKWTEETSGGVTATVIVGENPFFLAANKRAAMLKERKPLGPLL